MNSQQNSERFGAADQSILLRAAACSGPSPLTPLPQGERGTTKTAVPEISFSPLSRRESFAGRGGNTAIRTGPNNSRCAFTAFL